MKRQRKTQGEPDGSGAQKKLSRLLATESELETMLAQTRVEAAQIVEDARKEAEGRLARFDTSLEAETAALHARIEQEREEAVTSIEADAERRIARLNQLSETSVAELAHHVLSLLIGEPEKAGSS